MTDVVRTATAEPDASVVGTPTAADGPADGREDVRTGLHADALRQAVTDHLRYSIGRPAAVLTPKHYYRALALAVRDRMQQRWTARALSRGRGTGQAHVPHRRGGW